MSNQNNSEHFNNKASVYHQYRQGFPPQIAVDIQSLTDLSGTAHVLDVGAGTGLFTQTLPPVFQNITALDPNQEMLMFLSDNINTISTLLAFAEETNLPDQSIDLITCARAFHWLDQPRASNEWHRILRAPGWIAVVMTGRRDDDDPLYALRNEAMCDISPKFAELRQESADRRADLTTFLNITHTREYVYTEVLTLDQFIGREKSKAYFPIGLPDMENKIVNSLTKVFCKSAVNEVVQTTETFDLVLGHLA